jgi:predicted secreted Zn-dependent protease
VKALRLILLGAVMGAFVGVTLYRHEQQRRQHAESEAFWNDPHVAERRRQHEERMKNDPAYRMRWAEKEALYGLR